MIGTFWLVIMISVAGGPWRAMEDKQFPTREACETAAHARWEHLEDVTSKDATGADADEEFEIGVSCQLRHSKSDPI